jgi:hypothetical protein
MLPFRIFPPYFLLRSSTTCRKCRSLTPVFAFGASGHELVDSDFKKYLPTARPFLLTNIASIPIAFPRIAIKSGANLERRKTRASTSAYYMNVCHCGASLGDYFLFSQPGHAFCPKSRDQAKLIHVRRLNGPSTSAEVDCRFFSFDLDLISV